MVFPIGASKQEFAADHLDRLLGKSRLDRFVHERSVTEDGDTCRTHEPERGAERRRPEAERYSYDEQRRVHLGGCGAEGADLEVSTLQLSDSPHAACDEDDDEEQQGVRDERVDAEHDEDGDIVAGEVGEIVVDAGLHLAEVGGLGDAFEVEELGDGSQVGEACAYCLRAETLKPTSQVEAGRDGVERNLDFRHAGRFHMLCVCVWIVIRGRVVLEVKRYQGTRSI